MTVEFYNIFAKIRKERKKKEFVYLKFTQEVPIIIEKCKSKQSVFD
jgi:hypothetical protein